MPLLVASHEAHREVAQWATGRSLSLTGHGLAVTYSVLTRLPGDARVSPEDAVVLIDANFAEVLESSSGGLVHREFARRGVAGGAVYDGLVALAAREHGATLVTRDARARSTYEALGVAVEILFSTEAAG